MRFPADTRKLLRESAGKPVEIPWPKNAPEPKPQREYTVQSSHRAGTSKLIVLFVDDDGKRAIVRMSADPIRLLGKSGGSTERVAGSISTRELPPPEDSLRWGAEYEPERVATDIEDEIVRAAHRGRNASIREEVGRAEEALRALQELGAPSGDIRFQQNLLRRIEQRLVHEEAVDHGVAA